MAGTTNVSPDEVLASPYDFVIIGGGASGLVVAARLTEDPAVKVLVLEAGESRLDDPKINIPAFMSQLYEDPNYDWAFKTVPQTAMYNRVVAQPRGKVLGGSSAINFMMYAHASKVDIDSWEKLGNPGWNFENLRPYYKKFETYNAPDEEQGKAMGSDIIDPSLHGDSGPIQITFPHATTDLDAAWMQTFDTLGLKPQHDPRLGATLGGYPVLKTIDKGAKRSYAASAFYAPNAGRPNLSVLTNAHVNRILFEKSESGPNATGVAFSVAGKDYTVSASAEVILAAGAFQTPQILELSGIGSKTILQKHNIEVVVDNPNVGENLQDHTLVPLQFETLDGIPTAETIKQPGVFEWSLGEWQAGRGGPLAAGIQGTSFLNYPSVLSDESRSDLIKDAKDQLDGETPVGLQERAFEVQKEVFWDDGEADLQLSFARTGFSPYSQTLSGVFQHDDPGNYVGMAAVLTHPFSRGYAHIESSDPKVAPQIDPRYLTHPLDLSLTADAILFIQTVFETQPMSNFVKDSADGIGKKIQPAYKMEKKLDRAAAIEHAKRVTITSWHPIGTCSMLPKDEGGVVDERLRVYGVGKLRVVDASIFPLHVRGNIVSCVYAVAERAADIIKEDLKAKA